MSANLDKGLDEIISGRGNGSGRRNQGAKKSEKSSRASRGFKKAGSGTSAKTLGKAIAAATGTGTKNAKPQKKPLVSNPLEAARRALVSHLPTDVSAEDARSFFSSRIGRIKQVTGGFRQDGRPSGEFTFTFDAPGKALELMNKFNGQPIDGGKSKLAVQILLDANVAQAPKPLSERIGKLPQTPAKPAASVSAVSDKKKRRKGKRGTSGASNDTPNPAPVKAAPVKAAHSKTKKSSGPPRKARTADELDAEMSDYFAAADKNEISV